MHEYQVVGRKLPSKLEPQPQLFKMRLFARDEIVAKSRFFYFLRKLKKIKRSNGEIVSVSEVTLLFHSIHYFSPYNRYLKKDH